MTESESARVIEKSRELALSGVFDLDSLSITAYIDSLSINPDIEAIGNLVFRLSHTLGQKRKHQQSLDYLTENLPTLKNYLFKENEGKIIWINLLDELGSNYHALRLHKQAIETYMTGLLLAEKNGFRQHEAILCNNIGTIYMELNQHGLADSLFQKAVQINEKAKDHQKLFINYNNLSAIYTRDEEYEKGLEYAYMAMHQLKKKKDRDLIILMKRNIGSIYLKMKEYSLAKEQITEVMRYQLKNNQEAHLIHTYPLLAEVEQQLNQPDSVDAYLQKAYSLALRYDDLKSQSTLLKKRSALLFQNGNKDIAYELLNRLVNLRDSMAVYEARQKEVDLKHMIQAKQHIDPRKEKIPFFILLVICLTAIFFVYKKINLRWRKKIYALLRKMVRQKNEKLEIQNHQIDLLIRKREEKSSLLEQSERKRTLLSLQAMKNKELAGLITSDLSDIINQLPPRTEACRSSLRKMLVRLNQFDHIDNWKEFENSFENVYSSFYEKLIEEFPLLTPKELRLSALLTLGLNTKEIAEITYKEVRSVESARNRLRKKLQLEQQEDLTLFLTRFGNYRN